MNTRFSIGFDFRHHDEDIIFDEVVVHFCIFTKLIDFLYKNKKIWLETGFSRKNALKHIAFENNVITDNTYSKWINEYNKDKPLFVNGVWDGGPDTSSSGISYRKMFFDEKNRVNVAFNLFIDNECINVTDFVVLLSKLACDFNCSYINVESNGYRFFDNNVFPDRLSVGWMVYIPSMILPELIPEAASVVPVMDDGKQKGTIVVSTEEIFDGNNKEHIGRSNNIEIKLLDLGLLPLMTEL